MINREISPNTISSKSYLSLVVSYYYLTWVLVVSVWMKRRSLFKKPKTSFYIQRIFINRYKSNILFFK